MPKLYPASWNLRGLRITQNEYFSLLTHTKQLLFITFNEEFEIKIWDTLQTPQGQTRVKNEIVIHIFLNQESVADSVI